MLIGFLVFAQALSHIDWLIVSTFIRNVDSARAAHLSTWLWLKCRRFVERGNFWVVATRADLILLWYKAGFPSLSCRSIVYPACQPLIKKLQAPALAPASPILALLWCEPTPKPCYPRPIALRWKVPPLQLNARPWGSLSRLLSETVECLASARGDALVPDLKSETKLGNGVHLSSKPITPHSTPLMISIQRMCRENDPESLVMTQDYSSVCMTCYKRWFHLINHPTTQPTIQTSNHHSKQSRPLIQQKYNCQFSSTKSTPFDF